MVCIIWSEPAALAMEGGSAHTCGASLDHFAENAELSSLISSLPHVCDKLRTLEASQERFTCKS